MPREQTPLPVSAEDRNQIFAVQREILKRLPRRTTPDEFFGELARQAIDEVLSLGKKRHSVAQLEAPEQTYIGTRLEILVRDALDFAPGKRADASIAGIETDIKWSKSQDWMIGPENLDTVCLGIGSNRVLETVSVGLFIPHRQQFGGATNRDQKFTAGGPYRRAYVTWVVRDAELPSNFIEQLSEADRDRIMSGASAQERVRLLAECVPNQPVPRSAIRYVTLNKDDFMRRTREDKTRKSSPLGDMVCLSAKYKKKELERLDIHVPPGHFVFVPRAVLMESGPELDLDALED